MGAQIKFEGIPNNSTLAACESNTLTLNNQLATLIPGDTFLIPNTTFYVQGGVFAENISDVVIQLDGTLKWSEDKKSWPYHDSGAVHECWYMQGVHNVTFTSSGAGTLDGSGHTWWGYLSYLTIQENRPRLFHINDGTNLLMENWYFESSPYWTTLWVDMNGLEIRNCHVNNRRDDSDGHSWYNIAAFNTDGFDVSGANIHIHDCHIWNQDDCIAVQWYENMKNSKCTENLLFERIHASGMGLTIGSIAPSPQHTCVRDVTFRNCTMHKTIKGLYLKSRPVQTEGTGMISNILYEDIIMNEPEQFPIWIGPAQQVENIGDCSFFWPWVPFAPCPVQPYMTWQNLTFRNIEINDPTFSPGVILGNDTNSMSNIIFDNVKVNNGWHMPFFGDYYKCDGIVNGTAIGGTNPVPPCFEDNN